MTKVMKISLNPQKWKVTINVNNSYAFSKYLKYLKITNKRPKDFGSSILH